MNGGENEGKVKRRRPAPKGLSPPLQDSKQREPQVGFQEDLGPLPGRAGQGYPQVSLTPQVVERVLVGVPPDTQHEAPFCLSLLVSSSSFLTRHHHPLPCPGQGGAQVKLGARRGPRTFCSFLYHWLPGQECGVMSPVVVTGLQECGH